MKRRSFLQLTAVSVTAPFAVYASRPAMLTLYGDGVHDDTAALQKIFDGGPVMFKGREHRGMPPAGKFFVSEPVRI